MISVRDLWKVYGPRADRLVGSADADLPRAELEARLGELDRQLMDPALAGQRERYREVTREHAE